MSDRITLDPRICHGKLTIRGTRMPVSLVLGSLAGGMTPAEVRREYDLTDDDLRAGLDYARRLVDGEAHYPLPS